MNEVKKIRLSREEIANIEIGHTEVTRVQQWTLTLFFLLLIGIYPCVQMFYHQPFGEWRKAETTQKTLKSYENAIEDTSLLRRCLLTPAQSFMTGVLSTGNEKVIIGKDGWLFFSGDCEYLINSGFLRPEVLCKRQRDGVHPDPVKAILDFNNKLKSRGIRLILLPVPVKPMIYADKLGGAQVPLQNPSYAEFMEKMEAAGVSVVDLTVDFGELRKTNSDTYLKTDTHWTPYGMHIAASRLALAIDGAICNSREGKMCEVLNIGDIAAMLKMSNIKQYFPIEKVAVTDWQVPPRRESDVLLLGDSFANIYSLEAMKWGTGGGLAETLGAKLNRPVDAILRNDAGAFATRQLLSNELKRGRDRLAGKKVVIWEFAVRELTHGDWKMLDMKMGKVPETNFLILNVPRTVTATVLAVSTVPRPFSAPYKDHVMCLHLGDIDNGTAQALVYAASMLDNVWTHAANVRAGDTITIKLAPWNDYEAEYGSWNRSELDNESLLMADPCWGILQ